MCAASVAFDGGDHFEFKSLKGGVQDATTTLTVFFVNLGQKWVDSQIL